ncbi:hypothetical protein EOA23_18670 [Mesorhizobium sp. M2A.F.Ca.ET.042.01.1.1]|nr:hypothetical protein EOA23_18670 [Mesorhizobium sp. M2A.F.Ca.ET.042.01.1.1]
MIADGNSKGQSPRCGAAPHCPAGHFSPYSDGEKGLVASVASSPSPRSRGEGARRADEGRRRRLKGSVGALRRPLSVRFAAPRLWRGEENATSSDPAPPSDRPSAAGRGCAAPCRGRRCLAAPAGRSGW